MGNYLRSWRYRLPCFLQRGKAALGLLEETKEPVSFVIEKEDWAIRRVGENICKEIEKKTAGTISTTTNPEKLLRKVVHFGSQYMWLAWGPYMSDKNEFITSFFHGKPEDGPEVALHIKNFLQSESKLSKIIVSTSLVEKRLKEWGVRADKIARIPIGVDTALFTLPTPEQRAKAREKLGFSSDQIVIGSFQKDGVGWKEGIEPKLIKGPDIFIETVALLSKAIPVAVLLTGPARGYVKKGLGKNQIPYKHIYLENYVDLLSCYHALDLYLITSREEGGPMGLMESMSSGVPVVSTPVGMAPDLIIDGLNGGLAESIQSEMLVNKVFNVLKKVQTGFDMAQAAKTSVEVCAWDKVAEDHLRIYSPLVDAVHQKS